MLLFLTMTLEAVLSSLEAIFLSKSAKIIEGRGVMGCNIKQNMFIGSKLCGPDEVKFDLQGH